MPSTILKILKDKIWRFGAVNELVLVVIKRKVRRQGLDTYLKKPNVVTQLH